MESSFKELYKMEGFYRNWRERKELITRKLLAKETLRKTRKASRLGEGGQQEAV